MHIFFFADYQSYICPNFILDVQSTVLSSIKKNTEIFYLNCNTFVIHFVLMNVIH